MVVYTELEDVLKDKEIKMIEKVIRQYGFQIVDIKKARSAYKIETDKGVFCLKRMKHGKIKVQNGCYLIESLRKNNFYNTAQYIKTLDNKLFVKSKGFIFYVTEWLQGEECNMNEIDEVINCVKLLANFHSACKNIDTSKMYIQSNIKNWIVFYTKCLKNIEGFKNAIHKKRITYEFDAEYEKLIDKYYERGLFSIKLLNESSYLKLTRDDSSKTICHDSFYYQNIIKKDNKYYIVDLDSIVIDLRINDLGKLIRRLMTKKEYKWDFDKTKLIIEAYNSINKLSKEELEIMLALIVFPHKFWKVGNKRYIKHKNWPENKYMRKLNKIILNNEYEDKFIQNYLLYLKKL